MSTTRIKDLTTASDVASDDYIALDGATNGTRKVLASDIGGAKRYSFADTISRSMDARGVGQIGIYIYATDPSEVTFESLLDMEIYLQSGPTIAYKLIITQAYVPTTSTGTPSVWFKSIHSSTQATSTSTISGYLHILSPFEISSIGAAM